jgi:hypothetical protein
MDHRFLWIAVILVGGLFCWGVREFVGPNGSDVELQQMLEALKQVRTFRGTYTGKTGNAQHSEQLWEVDCNQGIVHKQSQELLIGANPVEVKDEEYLVGSDQKFTRTSDGSWEKSRYTASLYSASWYCHALAQATVRDLVPDVRGLIKNGSFAKGDEKTVNGVRCQEWKYTNLARTSGQRGLLCIGLEDHLPYEMTVENQGRYSYSDFNQPLQFDAPEAVLESASSTGASN